MTMTNEPLHVARHDPGEDRWTCRCGYSEPFTTALAMQISHHEHVRRAGDDDGR